MIVTVVVALGMPPQKLMATLALIRAVGSEPDVRSWDPETGTVCIAYKGNVDQDRLLAVSNVLSVSVDADQAEVSDTGRGVAPGGVATVVTKLV